MWSSLFTLLREEYFSNWRQGTLSSLAIIGALVASAGFIFKVGDLGTHFAPADNPLIAYVWTTFFFSFFSLAAAGIFLQRLMRRHDDIAGLNDRLDRAMILQHHMAETVRLVAAKADIDLNACLQRVLGNGLREYLKLRLGKDKKINCTVKIISRAPSGAGYQLKDVFRDDTQSEHARPRGATEPVEQNYIYARFKNADVEDAKQIYIPDVTSAGAYAALTTRAYARGYKAVLAFPLNLPAPAQLSQLGRLTGFLGIDSPDPHAFDELFDFCQGRDMAASAPNGDGVFKAREELNFLYALADSVATILMLVQSQPATRSES